MANVHKMSKIMFLVSSYNQADPQLGQTIKGLITIKGGKYVYSLVSIMYLNRFGMPFLYMAKINYVLISHM